MRLYLDVAGKELSTLDHIKFNKFRNLLYLNCKNNRLQRLLSPGNSLPNTLKGLYCDCNQLIALPLPLPSSLIVLNCAINKLTSLVCQMSVDGTILISGLPQSLKKLYCCH